VHITSTDQCVSFLEERSVLYVAEEYVWGRLRPEPLHLEETVAFCPFGHAKVSGLAVMEPPHANPAQAMELGEVISRMVSKGREDVSGMAMRNMGFVPRGVIWR